MKFHRIKGDDKPQNVIRLPRLGRIRLGIKKTSPKSGKEYPVETNYFVVPPEVEKAYGKEPHILPCMIPVEDEEKFLTQSYRCYGSNQRLKCHGDGERAERRQEDGSFEQIACPTPEGCDFAKQNGCRARIDVMVVLPDVNMGGCYQLSSGSINTDIDLRSGIEMARYLFGRAAWVPMILKREERKIADPETGKMQTHWPVQLYPQANIAEANLARQQTDRIIGRQAMFDVAEPVIDGPEDLPEPPKELEAPRELAPEPKPGNGNGKEKPNLSQKERVIEEIKALVTKDDISVFARNLNKKVEGLKTAEVLEISKEFNFRKGQIERRPQSDG